MATDDQPAQANPDQQRGPTTPPIGRLARIGCLNDQLRGIDPQASRARPLVSLSRRWCRCAAGLWLTCLISTGAMAFEMNPGAFANYMALQPMRERLERNHKTIFGASVEESLRAGRAGAQGRDAKAIGAAAAATTTFRPAATGQSTAERMAAAYPQASRAEAAKTFAELLAGFKRIESQLDLPENDVANAVAAFLSGNVWALRGAEVPNEHFVTLARQMRGVVGNASAFTQASSRDRQEMYEELVIVGMLMATMQMALARQPDDASAARAREAATAYLQHFLGTQPSRVRITASGLVIQ